MFQRSRFNYDETNDSPPFSDDGDDDDAKYHQTENVLEHYFNDSAIVSLSSTPEIPCIGSYHGEDFSQKHSRVVPQPRIGGELCSLYEIPRKYRHIFSGYPCFNSVQSKVLNDVLHSDTPVIVSAPTGSGKTVIFELAIIRLLMKLDELKYEGDFIIVYMAPVKALCSERYFDWKAKFSTLGINCQEVTGDTDDYTLANLPRSHLILTTPEKWDSLTRKWKDNTKMVQLVKLFLIDEVHLLSEERRGPTLEAVVSRMKTITDVLRKQKLQHMDASDFGQLPVGIRFMAVSATIYNIEDVASWLGTSPDTPAKYFKISEEQRPVKLQKIVIGYPCPRDYSQFRFEITLSFKLKPLLFKYAEGKPTLIFCSTRKGVDQTCSTLSKQITFRFDEEHRRQLLQTAQTLSENKLKSCIIAGVGYHHAGMDRDDRHTVENLFRTGLLPVLVTTSTLAIGVNLPAHLVIVKATQQYAGGAYHDYTETQILQMIGRAGRPQFDTSAVAIIMTKDSQKSRYENLVEGKEPLESNLHRHLAEHLNSEVVLHTITEVGHAIEWIRSTFLYVRAIQNPCHYGIPAKLSKKGIETKLQEMCQRELNALASANLITVDNLTDIRPTANGAIMARFYLGLGTMKIFKKVTGQENMEALLNLIAACDEFSGLKLRVNEKKNLNLLNKSKVHETIRFPLQGKIANTEMKVNCLIQALFGCLPVYEQSLKQDMLRISWTGERVIMALCQYLLQYKHYKVLLNATILAKCFRCKLWENSPYVSRQLKGIGPALSSLLVASHKTSFQAIAESNPRDVELILNRAPPMGDALKAEVSHLPKFGLRVEPALVKPSLTNLNIYIEMTNKHLVQEYDAAGDHHWLVLIIGTSDNKCLLIERFRDTYLLQDTLSRNVTVKHTVSTEIYIHIISEQWSGLDVSLTTKFDEPCQAKHTLDQYLLKIGIDSRGKSALEISSEAASVMKKRKRNSLSQEINAINEKSFYDGNRLTLDKFKFTPTRNKKLTPLQQTILDNAVYENEPNETDENLDKYNVAPFKNMKAANGQNVLTMANLHLSHTDVDGISQQTMLDKSVMQNIPNNSRQIQDCLRMRRNENINQNPFHDTTFKYNNFKTMEKVEDVESNDPKLCSQGSDTSETINADTEVLYTEPSEAVDAPYITHIQENKPSKHNTSNTAANDNALCNEKSKVTGWNKLIKRASFNEPQKIHETIDLTQDSDIPKNFSARKSSFTDAFQYNQTCNGTTSSFPYKSASQSHQTKDVVESSSHIHEASQSESLLKHFTTNHSFQNINAQRTDSANESPATAHVISPSDHTSILINADDNDLHGSNKTKQMLESDAQQHSQNKFSEINFSRSEETANLSNHKKDFTNQINGEMDQPASKQKNTAKVEQTFKRTLPKRFYPLFMKSDIINDDQDKNDEIDRKETHTENKDTHTSPVLQTETSTLSEASPGQQQKARGQTAFELKYAFKDIQENEEHAITMQENREGNSMGNSSPVFQPYKCENQQANINSKSENNNELQFHPIIPHTSNGPIKSFSEKCHEKTVESNILAHMNPETVNIQPTKQFPHFPQNCNILQPALSFSLVPDFDKFFEKLSDDPNSKNMQFYQHATEAETSLIQTPKYDTAWARDYIFNRKTKIPLTDGNERFAQHSKSNGTLQDQSVLHYNVPTFNKNKIDTLPLNYVEAGTYTTNEPTNNGAQTNKEIASLNTNCIAKFKKMPEELNYNYNVNESFAISESRDKCVLQIPNKEYFNCFGEAKQHSNIDVPNDKYRDFDVNENTHTYSMEYPSPPQSFDSSETFHLHPEYSEMNHSPYIIDTHRVKEKHKQNNHVCEITENKSFFYGDNNPEESSTIFHSKNNELFQNFTPSNTFAHSLIYPEESNLCLFPAAATNLEETDEVHSHGSLEEEIQDYNKCLSPVASSPLISNVSPQNSDCCDLPTPPLQLSSDESDKCSQCSTCKVTSSSMEQTKENEPLVIPEQYETKQHPYMFPMNSISLPLPAPPPVSNIQHVKQKHPATPCSSDLQYKRPRSIYLPNDKLQKFCPTSPTERKIKFSPAYKRLKWFPR